MTIYLCGDSTMEGKPYPPGKVPLNAQTGWGQVFHQLFDEKKVIVENHASGGRSTKSFYEEGRLQTVLDRIQPGDYMIIQFGHNDQKEKEAKNHTSLGETGTYRSYLSLFVEGARAKKAQPILLTSICRRCFLTDELSGTLSKYVEEMKLLAQELHVPLLDLQARTKAWITSLGDEAAKPYYMVSVNGTDNTHLTGAGALMIAEFVVSEIRQAGLPLVDYLAR